MPKFRRPENCANCPYKSKAFSFLSKEELKEIQKNCLSINFKKGENICKQGTKATNTLYISNGLAKIYIEGRNRNIILKLVPAGQFVGLHTIFYESQLYNFSLTAIEDTTVCMINADFFREFVQKNPEFMNAMMGIVSSCSRLTFDVIYSLIEKSARGRLIDVIMYMAEEVYNSYEFDLPVTRKELAELCFLSTENTVRILSELRKEKLLALNGRHIKILQPDLLQQLSNIS